MTDHPIVSHEEWLKARLDLLAAEKELTHRRDALTRRRMAMPWVRVEKDYRFHGPEGELSLADLFDGCSQLIVHQFMFAPDWEEGCKSCSFWADHYDGMTVHLAHRDVTLAAVSRAPYEKIDAYRKRMGWRFPWVSSFGSDYNYDYQASCTDEELAAGVMYLNYKVQENDVSDQVGFSVFARDEAGTVFHTYSCYQRGIDALNGTYQFLDLVPKGRDEDAFSFPMTWVRRHDRY
jgi:predicted dithiol-disulfide oxidoreductase (DUF899 family)